MTEVSFHVNLPDKLHYTCRLLRKATGAGRRVVVTGDARLLRQLDAQLWTFSALDFLPHCFDDAPAAVLAASPVVLAQVVDAATHQQVLLNLGPSVPDGFAGFERLIEVVGSDAEELELARKRWKHYATRGYVLTRHDPPPQVAN